MNDSGAPLNALEGAVGLGALAIGNIKYQVQHKLLKLILATDKPVYLDFREAFSEAQKLV